MTTPQLPVSVPLRLRNYCGIFDLISRPSLAVYATSISYRASSHRSRAAPYLPTRGHESANQVLIEKRLTFRYPEVLSGLGRNAGLR